MLFSLIFAAVCAFANPTCMDFSGLYKVSATAACPTHEYNLDPGLGMAVSIPFPSSFNPAGEVLAPITGLIRVEQTGCATLKFTALQPVSKSRSETEINALELMQETRFDWNNDGIFLKTFKKQERYSVTITKDEHGNILVTDQSKIYDRFVKLVRLAKFNGTCMLERLGD